MAALPSIGRAASVERPVVRGADATSDLYERFSGQIFGYCLHHLGSREEAEDAVQTTFMNAFRGLQRGIVPELESAWLFKIAHNVCLSRRRSTWRRGRVEAPNNLEVLQEVVPARERVADELLRLQDVLEEMPENQRRAILLREWQGLTYREISEELDLSQAAVETLIFRARRALAAGLEETPDAEAGGLRKKARHGADAGAVLVALKALLSGGGAKVAATAILVATTAIAGAIGGHQPARHARQAAPTPTKSSPTVLRTTQSTYAAAAAASRNTLAAPAKHQSSAPGRTKPAPRPNPSVGGPARPSAPAPAPSASPAEASAPAAAPVPTPPQEKPAESHDSPASSAPPAQEQPGKIGEQGNGAGHTDKNSSAPQATQEQPPSATAPAPQADEHGNASNAPGQQDNNKGDKPDKSNGNGHK